MTSDVDRVHVAHVTPPFILLLQVQLGGLVVGEAAAAGAAPSKHLQGASFLVSVCSDIDSLANSALPKVILRAWRVEELAHNLHPRMLEGMLPSLVGLPITAAGVYPCNASTAVAQYWAQQDAAEGNLAPSSSSDSAFGRQPDANSSLLFLQLLAVNPAAARLLGIEPTLGACASALARQLQFQPSIKQDQQASRLQAQALNSLAEVCRDLAAYHLCCTAAGPHGATHALAPAPLTPPKLASCGDGLAAAVSAAYCAAPGGMLLPLLVLEHSAAGCKPPCTIPTVEQADYQQPPQPQQRQGRAPAAAAAAAAAAGPQQPQQPQQRQGQVKPGDRNGSQVAAQEGEGEGKDLMDISLRPSAPASADRLTPSIGKGKDALSLEKAAHRQHESSQGRLPTERASNSSGAAWRSVRENPGELMHVHNREIPAGALRCWALVRVEAIVCQAGLPGSLRRPAQAPWEFVSTLSDPLSESFLPSRPATCLHAARRMGVLVIHLVACSCSLSWQ